MHDKHKIHQDYTEIGYIQRIDSYVWKTHQAIPFGTQTGVRLVLYAYSNKHGSLWKDIYRGFRKPIFRSASRIFVLINVEPITGSWYGFVKKVQTCWMGNSVAYKVERGQYLYGELAKNTQHFRLKRAKDSTRMTMTRTNYSCKKSSRPARRGQHIIHSATPIRGRSLSIFGYNSAINQWLGTAGKTFPPPQKKKLITGLRDKHLQIHQ